MSRPALLLALAVAVPAGTGATLGDAAFVEGTVRRLLAVHDVPGAAVALVRGGAVVCAVGIGVRDTRTGEPVTEATRFPLGSVSKTFTTLSILRLVHEGRFDLDRPILRDLPDLRLGPRAFAERLTLRHLLSHTSGFPTLPEWALSEREAIVRRLAEVPLGAPPGTSWAYCNQNFLLAAHVAERRLGRRWEDLAREAVFEPLGLRATGIGPDALRRSTDHALPHLLDVRAGMVPIGFEAHLEGWGPSGGIHSSAADLARCVRFLVGDGTFEGRRLLPPSLLEAMRRPQVPVADTPRGRERSRRMLVTEMGYALGAYTEVWRGRRLVEHEGTLDGFTAGLTLVPDEATGVAILANAHHAETFLRAARLLLLEDALGLEPQPDLEALVYERAGFDPVAHRERLAAARSYRADPSSFAPLLGAYEPGTPGEPGLSIRREGEALFLTVGGRVDFEIVPCAPGRFLTTGPRYGVRPLSFEQDEAGSVTLLAEGKVLGRKAPRP